MKINIERLLQLLDDNEEYFREAYSTIGVRASREYKLMCRNHIHRTLLEEEWKKGKSDASKMVPGASE